MRFSSFRSSHGLNLSNSKNPHLLFVSSSCMHPGLSYHTDTVATALQLPVSLLRLKMHHVHPLTLALMVNLSLSFEISCDQTTYEIVTQTVINCTLTPIDARECVFAKDDDGLVCRTDVTDRRVKTKTGMNEKLTLNY